MEGRYAATAGSVVAAIHRYVLLLLRIQRLAIHSFAVITH